MTLCSFWGSFLPSTLIKGNLCVADLLPAGAHLFPGTAGGALTSRLGWMIKVQRAKMDKRNDRFCCKSVNQAWDGGLLNAAQEYSAVTNLSWYMDTCRRASTETSWWRFLVCSENNLIAASEYLWLSSTQIVKAEEQNLSNGPPHIQLQTADSQRAHVGGISDEKKKESSDPFLGLLISKHSLSSWYQMSCADPWWQCFFCAPALCLSVSGWTNEDHILTDKNLDRSSK